MVGMTTLPCFVGDAEPLLTRVLGSKLHMHGMFWLLTHAETRKTKRLRLLIDYLSRRSGHIHAPSRRRVELV